MAATSPKKQLLPKRLLLELSLEGSATLIAVPSLVALAMPGGPAFVRELGGAWDAGDAVLPVDPRLPAAAAERVLERLRPSVVVDAEGERSHRPGGVPVGPG